MMSAQVLLKFRLLFIFSFLFLFFSCAGTRYGTDTNKTRFADLKRSHYKLTEDMVAEAEVQTYFGFIRNNNSKWNYSSGDFQGMGSGVGDFVDKYVPFFNAANPAEELALYKMIKDNPKPDYFVNIRVINKNKNFLIARVQNVKVKAKGIILKKDEEL